jgi:hypothetical protein
VARVGATLRAPLRQHRPGPGVLEGYPVVFHRYSYMDFVRIGVPLNLLTWAAGVAATPVFFPF